MNLDGKFATELRGHDPLEVLHDAGKKAAVVVELLSAILDPNAGFPTKEFIVRTLIDVLEAAPAADVVDEDAAKVGGAGTDVRDELLETFALLDPQATDAFIPIGPHD